MNPTLEPAQPKRSTRTYILMALLVAFVGFIAYRVLDRTSLFKSKKAAQDNALTFKQVEIVRIENQPFSKTLPLSGALTPYNQAIVSARANGEILSVNFRVGQVVNEGDVLAKINPTSYDAQVAQASANLNSAQSSLASAVNDYDNNKQLAAKRDAKGNIIEEGFISDVALKKFELAQDAAKAQLASAQSALQIAQQSAGDTLVRAPLSGVLSESKAKVGETASPGAQLFTVVNTSRFELQAPISAEQIGAIQVGQRVQLNVNGLSDAVEGTVERINPAASNGSRSFVAYIRVDNPNDTVKAGMYAQGAIVLLTKDNTLSVPATALHSRDNAQFVYVLRDNAIAEQTVTIGERSNDAIDAQVEVLSGISAGDQVIRLDLGKLKVGTKAQIEGEESLSAQSNSKKTQSWWQRLLALFGKKTTPSEK